MGENDSSIIPAKKLKNLQSEYINSEMKELGGDLEANLYFAPERIQKKRLMIMKNCAIRNGFTVIDEFNNCVTHIVTEFEEAAQVLRSLKININEWFIKEHPKIVNTKWFAECIKQGRIIEIQPHHCIKMIKPKNENAVIIENKKDFYQYSCQRINPLRHQNHKLTDALEILAEEAELKDDPINMGRAIAFRKAASVLKSFPKKVSKIEEVENIKNIGKHSLKVIREILEKDKCYEVEEISKSEWFLTVKLFNSIYGIGPATAKQWYALGLRTIEDARSILKTKEKDLRLNYGLAFYEDLSKPVSKSKALDILKIIETEAKIILENVLIYLIGGFRRGKTAGHDIDILLSHPTEGKETGLLSNLLKRLKEKGLVLYGGINKSNVQDPMQYTAANTSMDNFEKCFLILKDFNGKCSKNDDVTVPGNDLSSLLEISSQPRNWTARRVDLVISPFSQFAFALVGWTGNKHFNRSLRDYAKKEKNMRLTSHGLYDFTKKQLLSASTEEEVFAHLDLPYYEPYYRNA